MYANSSYIVLSFLDGTAVVGEPEESDLPTCLVTMRKSHWVLEIKGRRGEG
jgi:hypothetical protein